MQASTGPFQTSGFSDFSRLTPTRRTGHDGYVWATRVASALLLAIAASAQPTAPLLDRLIAAETEAERSALMDTSGNAGAVDSELLDECLKQAGAMYGKGKFADALRAYEAALSVGVRIQSVFGQASAYRGIGQSQRSLKHSPPGFEADRTGYPLAVQAGDKRLQAGFLRGFGRDYELLGELDKSMEYDRSSIDVYRELGDDREVAAGLINLASKTALIGDLRLSIQLYERAMREGAAYADIVDRAVLNLASTLARQGDGLAAERYLQMGLEAAERRGDRAAVVDALLNLGIIYNHSARRDEALRAYARALDLARQEKDAYHEAIALLNRSAVHSERGDHASAISGLRDALDALKSIDAPVVVGAVLIPLADLLLRSGDVREGCADARAALDQTIKYRDGGHLWEAYVVVGRCEHELGDHGAEAAALADSIRAVEEGRDRAAGDAQLGASFISDRIRPYREMIGVLREERHDAAAAFEYAERAKARELVDTLRSDPSPDGRGGPANTLTPEEKREEARLGSEVARLDREIATANPTPAARKAWENARAELATYRAHLYGTHPELAVQRGEARPVAIPDLKDLLPNRRTALIEYSTSYDAIFAFVFVRGADGAPRFSSARIPIGVDELEKEVLAYRGRLASRALDYRASGTALYKKLLGPLESALAGTDSWAIVPDGPLWSLPFEALVTPSDGHLIDRAAIFYAPSLTYLRERRRLPKDAPAGAYLALGSPGSAHLANSTREAVEIGKLLGGGGVVLTGAAATKERWLAEAPSYRVLHLATHGVLNSTAPIYSWLSLAGAKPGAPDEALEAREVIPLRLRADIAVLSACETARGETASGEGMLGMSWAFLMAGASTTVVSQWAVDSASTTQLMLAFYRGLKPALAGNGSRASALRSAALAVKSTAEFRHPFYWAGFVEVGDGL